MKNKIRQIVAWTFVLAFASSAAPLNRKAIDHKLNNTIIPVVGNLKGYTMEETIEVLFGLSGKKINFLYFAHLGPKSPTINTNQIATPPLGGGPSIDPTTGLPLGPLPGLPLGLPSGLPSGLPPFGQPAEPIDQPEPKVTAFTGSLKNLTLKQVLDVVVMSMQPPVQYVIMDYGVAFIPRDKDKPLTPIRVLRINPSVFGRGLRNTNPQQRQSPFGPQQPSLGPQQPSLGPQQRGR